MCSLCFWESKLHGWGSIIGSYLYPKQNLCAVSLVISFLFYNSTNNNYWEITKIAYLIAEMSAIIWQHKCTFSNFKKYVSYQVEVGQKLHRSKMKLGSNRSWTLFVLHVVAWVQVKYIHKFDDFYNNYFNTVFGWSIF